MGMVESWASPLIGLGVCQVLFSLGMIIPASLSMAMCQHFYYVSFAAIPGVFLFIMGCVTISGFKCSPRMLLGLGLINFFLISAALAGLAAGGIGLKCELDGHRKGTRESQCALFANVMGSKCKTVTSADKGKGIGVQASILVFSLLECAMCIAAATVSIRARSRLQKAADGDLLEAPYQPIPSQPMMGGMQSGPPPSPISISNVNTLDVTTNVSKDGEVMTTTAGEDAPPPPPLPPAPPRSRSRSRSTSKSRSSKSTSRSGSRSSRSKSSRSSEHSA